MVLTAALVRSSMLLEVAILWAWEAYYIKTITEYYNTRYWRTQTSFGSCCNVSEPTTQEIRDTTGSPK